VQFPNVHVALTPLTNWVGCQFPSIRVSESDKRRRMAPPRGNYAYLSLHDAFGASRPSAVNLYAIVTEWTMPRATRGTDYHVVLKVIDPSVASIVGRVVTHSLPGVTRLVSKSEGQTEAISPSLDDTSCTIVLLTLRDYTGCRH
jgi:hypothetical protein